MSAAITKFMNPAFYKQAWSNTCSRAYAKYHPTTRDNRYVLQSTLLQYKAGMK
ncbi:MAG: hypothetical protein ACI90V_008707 [Bacillariaceae sp.]|jgi:hypothetical protein